MIVHPPVEANLARLVQRADDQANAYGEQLDFGERDLDISADEQSLIQNPIQDLDESC